MQKIEILGKTIGKVYVSECLGGKPLKYSCICPCGDTFTACSHAIRGKKVDCGCGAVSGIRNKTFKTGDVYQGSRISDVSKKYKGQTCYTFICAKCGEKHERVHSDFLRHPVCSKCLKRDRDAERDAKITEDVVGKEVNGIKILRVGRDEKSILYVDAICPVCKKEFKTTLARVKSGISSCKECAKSNLQEGYQIVKDSWVEGTSILAITDRALNKNSTTGYKGVSLHKDGRYRAYIYFKRKQYHLGLYDTPQQAAEARKTAEEKIYGDFLKWYAEKFPEQWERMNRNGCKKG